MRFVFLFLVLLSPSLGDDFDTFFELCDEYLEAMKTCGSELVSMEESLLDGITTMSSRIVYTETLILDEATQIGYMADRIVETEYLMSNLTQECVPFCKENKGIRKWKEEEVEEVEKMEEMEAEVKKQPKVLLEENQGLPRVFWGEISGIQKDLIPGFCTPLGEFNEVLNASLIAFEAMCANVTSGVIYMNDQIGIMADRILFTEGLIMNFSGQIGEMADRIVETEQLAANATSLCCQIGGETGIERRTEGKWESGEKGKKLGDQGFSNFRGMNERALQPPLLPSKFGGSMGLHVCKSWWNPFCCAMEVMTDMMVAMLLEMAKAAPVTLYIVEEGADAIGVLADFILYLEEVIVVMGMEIGYIADDIVSTERMLIDFMSSPLCEPMEKKKHQSLEKKKWELQQQQQQQQASSTPRPAARDRGSLSKMKKKLQQLLSSPRTSTLKSLNLTALQERKHLPDGANPFGDFAGMVDCMTQMSDTMSALILQQMGVGVDVMTHMGMVTNDIFKTMGLIVEMIGQIEVMAGRIVETNNLMTNLTMDCITM